MNKYVVLIATEHGSIIFEYTDLSYLSYDLVNKLYISNKYYSLQRNIFYNGKSNITGNPFKVIKQKKLYYA